MFKNRVILLQVRESEVRLDQALKEAIGVSVSRNQIKNWFYEGRVLLNQSSPKPSLLLRRGEYEVTLVEAEFIPAPAIPSSRGSFLPIIHEDSDLLILNKQSGVPSIPHSSEETETAVGSALAHLPGLSGIGKDRLEPGLIHRLDTETSGLLVFTKTQDEYNRMGLIWKEREVEKIYRAQVELFSPAPTKLPFRIEYPLAHDSKSAKRMIALTDPKMSRYRGKPIPARTEILSVRKYSTQSTSSPQADLEIQIETGVMHQIRCHLSTLGWPILGDKIYNRNSTLQTSRMWLHAWKLRFPSKNGKKFEFECPLPEGWAT